MAANITPVDVFTTTITVPTDGDAVNGTERALPVQALADRTQFLFNRMPQASVQTAYPVSMTSVTVQGASGNNVSWLMINSGIWLQEDLTSTYLPTVDITGILPAGGTLNTIRAYVQGEVNSGAHGTFPGALDAQLPFIQLEEFTRSTASSSITGKVIDPSTSNAEYTTLHTIESTGLGISISSLDSYFIEFRGETGGGWGIVDSCGLIALELGWTL